MSDSAAELLAYLARELVSQPDQVVVDESHDDDGLVLQLHVAADDLGRVIGRGGRTARALRTVVRAAADGRRTTIDIVGPDD